MVEGDAYWVYNKTGDRVVVFINDPLPKADGVVEQSYSSVPEDAPRPPAPPGTVSTASAFAPGTGGGGGGDFARQVGGDPVALAVPFALWLLLVLVLALIRGRLRSA